MFKYRNKKLVLTVLFANLTIKHFNLGPIYLFLISNFIVSLQVTQCWIGRRRFFLIKCSYLIKAFFMWINERHLRETRTGPALVSQLFFCQRKKGMYKEKRKNFKTYFLLLQRKNNLLFFKIINIRERKFIGILWLFSDIINDKNLYQTNCGKLEAICNTCIRNIQKLDSRINIYFFNCEIKAMLN